MKEHLMTKQGFTPILRNENNLRDMEVDIQMLDLIIDRLECSKFKGAAETGYLRISGHLGGN